MPQEIATFCKLTHDVSFPMFEKVVTRSGMGQSPSMRSSAAQEICPPGISAVKSSIGQAVWWRSFRAMSRPRSPAARCHCHITGAHLACSAR